MYEVMIVDDDKHIRSRLKTGIDWHALGLTFCCEASDGDEALSLYEQRLPSIVIMDINIPNKDGLEVAQEIMLRDPEAVIICITGFNDFEYAQTAIKVGVVDMLTKPLDMGEVQDVLRKAARHIDGIRENRQNLEKLNALVAESLPVLQRVFLQGLLEGAYELPEKDILERMGGLGLEMKGRYYAVALIHPRIPEASQEELDVKHVAVSHTGEELLMAAGFKCASFYSSFGIANMLLSWSGEEQSLKLDEVFSNVRNKLLFYFNIDIYVGIGSVVRRVGDLRKSMSDAQEALGYRYYFAQNNIVNIKNVIQIFNRPSTNYKMNMDNIVGCFKSCDMEKLSRRLDELVADVASATYGNEDGLRRIFIELTVLIMHIASDIGVDADEILGHRDPYRAIMQMNNIGELIAWFKNLCEEMIAVIQYKKGKRTNRIVATARDHIEENYSDSNLCLISISEHVGLSSVYFSQLFHAETGVRLSEYINTVRIEKAKEMLRNSTLKIYEIAYKTGYNNPKYFNYVFKKQAGLSPNEYRQGGV